MNKYLIRTLIMCLLISLMSQVKSEKKSNYDGCIWKSDLTDEAIIKTKIFSKELKSGTKVKADLIFKNKIIGTINMGEPNGYGSKWWDWEITNGKSLWRGGRLLPFFGNLPARGSLFKKDYILSNPRKVLFVNMGSSFYYGGYRGKFELIRAAEGLWTLDNNCYFPGYLFNDRHLGL